MTHPTLLSIAQDLQIDVAQVILLWLTGKGFAVLAKSSTPARIQSNLKIGGGICLTPEQSEKIDQLSKDCTFKCEWDPHEYP